MKLAPKIDMILSLVQSQLTWPAAISEFVDNSFGPDAGNANEIIIDVDKERVIISDDGEGFEDINSLYQLGAGTSRQSSRDIGLYGIGSKHAQLWIGATVSIDTIRAGRVHHHTAKWPIIWRRTGPGLRGNADWPNGYEGKGKAVTKGRGTTITIGQLHPGKPRLHAEAVCRQLGLTYAPAIESGRVITLIDKRGKWEVRHAVKADRPKELTDTRSFRGEMKGMSYKLFVGCQDKYESRYNALFVTWGHRVITIERNPFEQALPSRFYGRLDLDDSWKQCLSSNKLDVAVYKEDLMSDAYGKCKDLLDLYEEFEKELAAELFLEELSEFVARTLSVIDNTSIGQYRPGEVIKHGKGHADIENPKTDAREGGKNEANEVDAHAYPIRILRESLGDDAYRVSQDGATFVISLNDDLPYVADAFTQPFKIAPTWGLVSNALAVYLVLMDHKIASKYEDMAPEFRIAKLCNRLLALMPAELKAGRKSK